MIKNKVSDNILKDNFMCLFSNDDVLQEFIKQQKQDTSQNDAEEDNISKLTVSKSGLTDNIITREVFLSQNNNRNR